MATTTTIGDLKEFVDKCLKAESKDQLLQASTVTKYVNKEDGADTFKDLNEAFKKGLDLSKYKEVVINTGLKYHLSDLLTTKEIDVVKTFVKYADLLSSKEVVEASTGSTGKTPYQELKTNLDSTIVNWSKNGGFPEALELMKLVKARTTQLKQLAITNEEIKQLDEVKEMIKNTKDKTQLVLMDYTLSTITTILLGIRPTLPMPETK